MQFDLELDYFHRILYGISKAITEYIDEKQDYSHVKKVISVNIVYFDLGEGKDYIYHGTTNFTGKHLSDQLALGHSQKKKFSKEFPAEIYPEIFLIKVNNFNDVSVTTLDEWIYFLKNSSLPENYSARGLKEVEQKLKYEKMNTAEKQEYDNFIKSVRISKSALESARFEGREEGITLTKVSVVLKGYENNLPISLISNINDLSEEEVIKILKDHGKMV